MRSPDFVVGLAERQGHFKEVQRLSEIGSTDTAASEGPWIALSRQVGAGGAKLAAHLAERLGWQVYDREILSAVAAGTHSDELLVERFDEKGIREVGEFIAPFILPDDPGQARYLLEMRRVIRRIGREGRAILVGRGANWILSPAAGLRIRVVAAAGERAAVLARTEGLSVEASLRRIEKSDAAQRKYIRQAFQREIDDPAGYDLVVSPLSLGLDAAAAAVLAAARTKLDL